VRAGHLLRWVAPLCVFRRENSGFAVGGALASTTCNNFIADLLFLSEVPHPLLVAATSDLDLGIPSGICGSAICNAARGTRGTRHAAPGEREGPAARSNIHFGILATPPPPPVPAPAAAPAAARTRGPREGLSPPSAGPVRKRVRGPHCRLVPYPNAELLQTLATLVPHVGLHVKKRLRLDLDIRAGGQCIPHSTFHSAFRLCKRKRHAQQSVRNAVTMSRTYQLSTHLRAEPADLDP
jgi:hypothetical protein